MKSVKFYLMICFSLLVLISGSAEAEERAKAHVQCEKTDIRLVYDCLIVLTGKKSGKPMEGAKFEVGADMPSMPMAHSVKPVMAMPGKKPGTYHVRIQLKMYGEWALKIDLKEPMRDLLIHKMYFGEEGTGSSDGVTRSTLKSWKRGRKGKPLPFRQRLCEIYIKWKNWV